MKKRERGFTLVELLVVIAILGVLGGIAVPRVLGAVENARRNGNIANRTILQSAVERYNIDNGNWPVTGRALPTGATVVPLVGPDLANYLQGGVLPPVNVASMGDPDGTGPLTGDTLTTHRWGINAAGVVIIVNAAGDAVVWHP